MSGREPGFIGQGVAYRGGVVVTEQQSLLQLQGQSMASLADTQVIFLRDLAARLTICGAADAALRVDATADQLEAAAREAWRVLRPDTPPQR